MAKTGTSKDEIYFTPEGSPVAPDPFDVRIRLRSRSRGGLTTEALKKYYASLPDDTASAVVQKYQDVVGESSDGTSLTH